MPNDPTPQSERFPLPDTYAVDVLRDSQGNQFTRFRAPFDNPSRLIDPTLWPRLFNSANSAHISAAIVSTRNGKQLYWAECGGVRELLKGRTYDHASVRLESDVVAPHDGTNLPERHIRITADGSKPGSAADARELAGILVHSGVDSSLPLSAYAIHPSFRDPQAEAQVLIDTRI